MPLPIITTLAPNEVFVFGSNSEGFHGAGAAGMAFSGEPKNNWRTSPMKQAAIRWRDSALINTSRDPRIGRWAIWGRGAGLSQGTLGMSYAIPTKRSPDSGAYPVKTLEHSFGMLFHVCEAHHDKKFLMTEVGAGYARIPKPALREALDRAIERHGLSPINIKYLDQVYL